MSADAENEYFADGITEEMISQLSRISGLEVIARTSVMKYKNTDKDIAEIGRELNVGTVLEGSVRKADNQIRVTAQLINVENQAHLWSEDYDRELKNVFAIQSDIAKSVTEALRVRLLAGDKRQIETKGTESLEAYNLYLKGRYYLNKTEEDGFNKAIEYFNQAIHKDPNYALAYAGLADSYNELTFISLVAPKATFPKAKAAALKALEINDNLAEAHTALAMVNLFYDWNRPEAEREFKRAIEINPSYAMAHRFYAWYFISIGRFEEAFAEIKKAQELDPVSFIINTDMGWAFYDAREYDRTIEQLRKTIELEPNSAWPYIVISYPFVQKGMYEEGFAAFQKAEALLGERNSSLLWNLGCANAASGRRDGAEKVLEELKEMSKHKYVPSLASAQIYAVLDEKDKAFEWLGKALEERDPWLIDIKVFPDWDNIRLDPRFTEVLKEMNLE